MAAQTLNPQAVVTREMLTPLVQRALDDPAARVIDFACRPAKGSYQEDTAVFFFTGRAAQMGGEALWSLVLKVIRPVAVSDDPEGIIYAKREALAYQSGMLYHLPGGISAPRLFAVDAQPGGETWLWMETVADSVGVNWPLEQYGEAARILGRFNGAYLTGACPLPQEPWVSRHWLWRFVERAAPMIRFIRENPRHSLVQRMFGGGLRPVVLAFWEERERMLDRLEGLPQTFCHQDAFRDNLFAQPGRLVAVDWSFMGIAPAGAELVALIGGSLMLSGIPCRQAKKLDAIAFAGYLHGLREAGWQGPAKDIRLVYCLALWLRYVIGGFIGSDFQMLMDEERTGVVSNKSAMPAENYIQGAQDQASYYLSILLEGGRKMGLEFMARLAVRAIKA